MKTVISSFFIIFLALMLVSTVSADVSSPQDAFVRATDAGANFNGNDLSAASTFFGSCTAGDTTYLKWSLSGISGEAGPLTALVLNVNFVASGSNGNLELFRVADDTWNEATITSSSAPALGASITSVPVPGSTGPISIAGVALAAYVNQESAYTGGGDVTAGDNTISLAIRITGCSNLSNVVTFDSKDKSGGVAPDLSVFNTTSVSLTTFHAADTAPVSWPLYAGLALLALLALTGTVVLRRRNA